MAYQLVAWTDKGQVKMLPHVLREYAQPFIDPIERRRAFYLEGWSEEFGRLAAQDVIALSRSYEAYGRFLLLHGKRQEAFEAFVDGACVCLDDRFKIDSEYGYVLVGALPKRYHYMKSFCLDLLEENPELARLPEWQNMLEKFRKLDAPFAEERRKDLQAFRANRAFSFGRQ
jgi:hypothetical protein